ncbi:MAG: hypothetical protein OXN27_14340 [Candidatus Poribacteria bacterium]|nr:hypothetical protein [Candidatus Poribacteria bacterium]
MENWKGGRELPNGRVEGWKNGREDWKGGRMEGWKVGRLEGEGWKIGGEVPVKRRGTFAFSIFFCYT